MSIILGIHDGHTATACLTKDGEILAMVSEERFNRKKNWGGVPAISAEWCLKHAGVTPDQIDAVAVPGLINPLVAYESGDRFPPSPLAYWSTFVPQSVLASDWVRRLYMGLLQPRRDFLGVHQLLNKWGLSAEKLQVHEHHHCHAASAYFLSGLASEDADTLVMTLDGSGDGYSGTVNVARGTKIQRRLALSSYHSLGLIYSSVTHYLGMKPLEHEYKVMGLAPYAPEKLAEKAYKIFCRYIGLSDDGLSIYNTSGAWGQVFYRLLAKDLVGLRFDAVAAGLQTRLEEVITTWVQNWIKHTGIKRLCFGGGVFMNVKLNMLIQALPEVESAFFMPSGGDESVAVGAANLSDVALSGQLPKPIRTLYLGGTNSEELIASTIREYGGRIRSEKLTEPELETAKLLAEGRVVGRCSGGMEWGARSLGNRALLADGRDLSVVRKLNAAIKQRDFWMPFAPSILWERRHDYLVNPRDVPAPFMALAFPSTPLAYQHIKSGLHAYDLTCRPQLVKAEDNPGYHKVLKHWESLTGCGGVLNTSFNLHGEPIVQTPRDAIETLLRSDIDDLIIENYRVNKPA